MSKAEAETIAGMVGISHLSHGATVAIRIKSPIGQKLKAEALFIGSNHDNYLFFTLPSSPDRKITDFFTPGFVIEASMVPKGTHGTKYIFKSKIAHITHKPVQLMVVEIPEKFLLTKLRSNTRRHVDLPGKTQLPQRKIQVNLYDISEGGFAFNYSSFGLKIPPSTELTVEIKNPHTKEIYLLSGTVKSNTLIKGIQSCGLTFDELGKRNGEKLIKNLTFNGKIYELINEKK